VSVANYDNLILERHEKELTSDAVDIIRVKWEFGKTSESDDQR